MDKRAAVGDVQRSVNKSDGQACAHFFISSLRPPPLLAKEPHPVLLYHFNSNFTAESAFISDSKRCLSM